MKACASETASCTNLLALPSTQWEVVLRTFAQLKWTTHSTHTLSLSLAHIYTNPNRRNFIWTNTHKLPFLRTVTDQSECGFQYNGMTIINQVFMYSFVYQHEINSIHSQTNKTWEVVMGWIAWHTWLLLPHANIKPEIRCWKCIQKYHLKISKRYICYRTISKEQSTPDFTLKM